MLLNRQLKYNEFKGFWECINNKEITPDEFRSKILSKYLSSNEGITEKGFIKFFEDTLLSSNGEVLSLFNKENCFYVATKFRL
jgi:hypothetical protein